MTPPDIARLEMDAAIAKEFASAADARAKIATLQHQRDLLTPHQPYDPGARRGVDVVTWFFLTAFIVFCVWSYATDTSHIPPGATTTSDY